MFGFFENRSVRLATKLGAVGVTAAWAYPILKMGAVYKVDSFDAFWLPLQVAFLAFLTLFAVYPLALEALVWEADDALRAQRWDDVFARLPKDQRMQDKVYRRFMLRESLKLLDVTMRSLNTQRKQNDAIDRVIASKGDLLNEFFLFRELGDLPHKKRRRLAHYPIAWSVSDRKYPFGGSWLGRLIHWLSLGLWLGVLTTFGVSSALHVSMFRASQWGLAVWLAAQAMLMLFRVKFFIIKKGGVQVSEVVGSDAWYTLGMKVVCQYCFIEEWHQKRVMHGQVIEYSKLIEKPDGSFSTEEGRIDLGCISTPDNDPTLPAWLYSLKEHVIPLPSASVDTLDGIPVKADIEPKVSLDGGDMDLYLYARANPLSQFGIETYKKAQEVYQGKKGKDVVHQSTEVGDAIEEKLRPTTVEDFGLRSGVRIIDSQEVDVFAKRKVDLQNAELDARIAARQAKGKRALASAEGLGMKDALEEIFKTLKPTPEEQAFLTAKYMDMRAASADGNTVFIGMEAMNHMRATLAALRSGAAPKGGAPNRKP